MDQADALFWLQTIAGGAGTLWLAGAWFVARTGSVLREPLRGEAEVASAPQSVTRRLAGMLAMAGRGSALQNAVIESANDGEVRWHSNGPLRHRGIARARGDARSSRVEWEITSGRGLLLVARIVVAAGALWTIGLYLALRELAVPSETPGVRGQVFQMAQAIHLLWPPFLFAGLARRMRTMLGSEVQRALVNAPFASL